LPLGVARTGVDRFAVGVTGGSVAEEQFQHLAESKFRRAALRLAGQDSWSVYATGVSA